MESEISGLEDLHAFLKHGNFVTRFSFPYLDVPSTKTNLSRANCPAKTSTSTRRRCGNWMRRSQLGEQAAKQDRGSTKQRTTRDHVLTMLTISKPLTASQAQTYHAKEFTSPDQNYWSRGQTVRGEWQGRLGREIRPRRSRRRGGICPARQGQHPATGEQLVQHRAGPRIPGRAWENRHSRSSIAPDGTRPSPRRNPSR